MRIQEKMSFPKVIKFVQQETTKQQDGEAELEEWLLEKFNSRNNNQTKMVYGTGIIN